MKPCTQCGTPMTSDSPQGLCARCLLSVAMADDAAAAVDSGATQAAPGGSAPAVAIIDIGDAGEVARRLPQFEIMGLLGRGGMGVVYKARQTQLDRIVALKILPPADAASRGFVERFRREARSLAKLSHPNIVSVYDFGESNGLFFFVMEFVDGLSLREMIRGHRLMPAEALTIVPRICDALQFAHEEGVVHRDIKPENILMDKRGRVKVADFGLAKLLGREETDPRLTVSGAVLGTPRYMAPEQSENPESVDHRADIYSLGVVFYELLTGELPVGRFPLPSEKVQIDVRLDEIVLHALDRDVQRRYQHASEVRNDVEEVTSKPPAVSSPKSPLEAPPSPKRPFPTIYAVFAPLIVAAGFFAALPLWNLRFPGCLLGGVVIFVALYGAAALGRRYLLVSAANWKADSRSRRALRLGAMLALCLVGYYFVLASTLARLQGAPLCFPPRDVEAFEQSSKGKEYELVRQLSAYKKSVPMVELNRHSWESAGIELDAFEWNCFRGRAPYFDSGWSSKFYFNLVFGFCFLSLAALMPFVATKSRARSLKGIPGKRPRVWPAFILPLAIPAGWCVNEYTAILIDVAHDPHPMYTTGGNATVNEPVEDVLPRLEQAIHAAGYVSSDRGTWGMDTVPQGEPIGQAGFINYLSKTSPFDQWHWRGGLLVSSCPHITVSFVAGDQPAETLVTLSIWQLGNAHLDTAPWHGMVESFLSSGKSADKKLPASGH